jgi:hypothetical protein
MTTRLAAARLKLNPKKLRAVLREIGIWSNRKSYDLTEADMAAVEKYLAAHERKKAA